MTGTVSSAWALLAVAVVAAASPMLAGWTVAFADGQSASWWRPRPMRWTQIAVVAAVAVALAAAAAPAQPRAAWLMLAAGGAVLSVVDVRTHRLPLPLPLTISLAAGEALVLTATALMDGDPGRLLRAATAALVVAAAWFCRVLAAPRSLGLGDVWVAAPCAALLGWSGWSTVLAGQAAAWVAAVPLAAAIAATRPRQVGRHMPVPLGPAIIAGAVVAAAWL